MKLLNELTIKNLKLNKKRSVMTIIAIMLSVALIFTVISMVFSFQKSVENIIANEEGRFHVKNTLGEKYSDIIKDSKDFTNISEMNLLGYSLLENKNLDKPYLKVQSLNKEDFEKHGLTLIEGRFPENSTEIVIPEHFNYNAIEKLKVGNTVQLSIGSRNFDNSSLPTSSFGEFVENEKLENTNNREYKIVGIIKRANYTIESYSDAGYTSFTLMSDNDKTIQSVLFYDLVNPSTISKHVEFYGDDIDHISINTRYLEAQGIDVKNSRMMVLYSLASILIIVIITTSVFIIRNSFAISIVEKTKQYGILKSLGATDKQVKKNILFEGLTLGLIGIVSGILLGILASFILIIIVQKLIGQSVTELNFVLHTPLLAYISSILLGLLTIFLSVNKIARRSIKLSPIESIRSNVDIKLSKNDIKTPKFIEKYFDIGGLISYKNLKRNKKKYRATIASLALSVAIFIGMNSFVSSAVKSTRVSFENVNFQLSHYFYSDKNLVEDDFKLAQKVVSNLQDPETYAIYKGARAVMKTDSLRPEVLENLKTLGYRNLDTIQVNLKLVNSESFDNLLKMNNLSKDSKYLILDNLVFKDENKSVVTNLLTKNEITIIPLSEDLSIKNAEQKLNVVPITNLLPGMFEYNNFWSINLYMRDGEFKDILEFINLEMMIQSPNPEKTYDRLTKYISENNLNFNLSNDYEGVKLFNNLLLVVQIFAYGFIIVITLIGLTNIFNTITNNIYSRKREFASLMSFGMSEQQIVRMSIIESMLIGVKALLYGIPIGLIISVLSNLALKFNVEIPYVFPLSAVLISIIMVLVLTFIIMNYSVSKIRKQNIIETIRNENI